MSHKVLLLIKGLGRGGAEQLLASAIPHLDRERFDYEVAYLLPHKDALVPEFEKAEIPVHCLRGARGIGWTGRLLHLVQDRQIELVHSHSPVPATGARLRLGDRIPRVYTEHNEWKRYHRLTYWANVLTFPRSKHVFAVSDHVRHSIRYPAAFTRRRMPQVETLYHGIDMDWIPEWEKTGGIRESLGLPEDAVVVGTVANLKSHKRLDVLIRAAAILQGRISNLRLVIVGTGPREEDLRRLVHELGLDSTVIFAGFREDAPRVAATFDVFALSSDHEGLSIALIEALALGKPAVVTDVGGLAEVVRDGVEGFLVPRENPAVMANRIARLLQYRSLREQMGALGRSRAAEFDIRKAIRRVEQVYAELLA
jgi:glycosyltransferase involved in cell wall biosynthesis